MASIVANRTAGRAKPGVSRWRPVALGTALAAGWVLGLPGAASATVPTFTWSGTASAASPANDGWSVAGNWTGGTAPTSSSKVGLDFPVLTCSSSTSCGSTSSNDLTGLIVANLRMALKGGAQAPLPNDYDITGNGVKIDRLTVTSKVTSGQVGQYATVAIPLTLGKDQTWSVELGNGSNYDLGAVKGSGHTLTVDLPVPSTGGGFLQFEDPVNTGPLTFATPSGSSGSPSIVVPFGASLNGTSGAPVTFTGTGLFNLGRFNATTTKEATTHFGPLTFTGSRVQLGDGGGNGPYGVAAAEGNVSFDSASSLSFDSLEPGSDTTPLAGVDYPKLTATGSVSLGSATLVVSAGCNQALGTVYTVVAAGGGVSGTFAGVANGAVVQASPDQQASCTASGATAPFLKFEYHADTVTATVVAGLAAGPGVSVPTSAGGVAVMSPNGTVRLAG